MHLTHLRHAKAWLVLRQNLLSALQQLCTYRPFAQQSALQQSLTRFCQHLIQYLAVGHLAIFSQGDSRHPLLTHIVTNTLQALDFNDKYTTCLHLLELEVDLTLLAQRLADRLQWEDQLIQALNSRL